MQCVAETASFRVDKNISVHLNLMSTDDEHYHMLRPSSQAWIHNNMRYAVLQIHRTDGNVVINCRNGRTRSPMYLVAYLVVCCGLEPDAADHMVRQSLWQDRACELDRDGRLLPVIESLI
jgi:hypothetical protein